MGTYKIPRNVKGESRILYVFSIKALIYTSITGAIGLVFYMIFNAIGMFWVGATIGLSFAGIGFLVRNI